MKKLTTLMSKLGGKARGPRLTLTTLFTRKTIQHYYSVCGFGVNSNVLYYGPNQMGRIIILDQPRTL